MKTGVKVLDAMTREPVVIAPEKTAVECARVMLKKKVGGVIVKEGKSLKGIVTEKDLVEKVVAKGVDAHKIRVSEIMSTRPVTIGPDIDLYEAIKEMRDEDVRRLPVVYNNEVVGIITEKDILRIEPSLFDLIAEKYRIHGGR